MSDERGESGQPWWHETPDELDDENPAGVGTAAQEAVKLASAVASWASRSGLSDTMRGIAEQTASSVRAAAARAAAAGQDADEHEQPDGETEDADAAAGDADEAILDAELLDDEVLARALGDDADDGEEPRVIYESTCDYCPVCQAMTLLRTVSPEAAEGMAEALAAVTDAVKQAVEGMATHSDSGPKVEHIHVD
ncbi:MAG: hypothetical protein WAV88_08510 [Candidatus Nanopelagicales bacterium]